MTSSLLLAAVALAPFSLLPRAEPGEEEPVTHPETHIPLRLLAAATLRDLPVQRNHDVKELGEGAAEWVKTLTAAPFDLAKSRKAFDRMLKRGVETDDTRRFISEVRLLYHFAGDMTSYLVLRAEADPKAGPIAELSVRVGAGKANLKTTEVAGVGKCDLAIKPKISDWERSDNNLVGWARLCVTLSITSGKAKGASVLAYDDYLWFGVEAGKAYRLKEGRLPMARSGDDSHFRAPFGIFEVEARDPKKAWVRRFAVSAAPTNRGPRTK